MGVVTGTWELLENGTLWRHIGASLLRVGAVSGWPCVWPCLWGCGWAGWRSLSDLEPDFPDPAADLTDCLDSDRHSVVWCWRCLAHLPDIHLVRVPDGRADDVGVHTIEKRYLRAAENFGVSRHTLFRQVVIPAVLPQIIVGMRIGLGVAWLVVVAAEMIALHSGLGYMIMDSRNAGNRYDLVIAGMIMIGLIGLSLDTAMRILEGTTWARWRYAH